ncbi:hypothetical protein J1N35_045029 [Gossypium stocksii]|uniref:Uncharacterized protein n=1 Tax=Gossypium stocksii TaxID=47602 RepID=A0A9D3ZGJ4_9ROSI|nr:hypothetical protein J1N35_045029 [Gossypium stocksii]
MSLYCLSPDIEEGDVKHGHSSSQEKMTPDLANPPSQEELIREGHLHGFRKLGQHVSCDMWYGLLLLENQLPFFVLLTLYGMIEPNPGPEGHLYLLATSALAFFDKDLRNFNPKNTNIRHLLHLVHTTFHPSLLGILEKIVRSEDNFQTSGNLIPSATELEDAGSISLVPLSKKCEEQGIENMFDIKFDKNTKKLKIPTLQVCDSTERIFRNYMAYEQLFAWEVPTFFIDYVIFIGKLINTSKDVELLRKSGIIDNLLGNDEAITQMFNKLCNSIYYNPTGFYYNGIAKQLNEHCDKKWNKWKAALKKNYFNTPWC